MATNTHMYDPYRFAASEDSDSDSTRSSFSDTPSISEADNSSDGSDSGYSSSSQDSSVAEEDGSYTSSNASSSPSGPEDDLLEAPLMLQRFRSLHRRLRDRIGLLSNSSEDSSSIDDDTFEGTFEYDIDNELATLRRIMAYLRRVIIRTESDEVLEDAVRAMPAILRRVEVLIHELMHHSPLEAVEEARLWR